MPESIKDTMQRVRRQRIHFKYEVEEVNGAIKAEEIPLPFVLGVLDDNSGDSAKNLKDRKFIEIDRDNFDDVHKLG